MILKRSTTLEEKSDDVKVPDDRDVPWISEILGCSCYDHPKLTIHWILDPPTSEDAPVARTRHKVSFCTGLC